MGLTAARERVQKRARLALWRARYWWLDTPAGMTAQAVACCIGLLVFVAQLVRVAVAALTPQQGEVIGAYWWVVQIVVMIVAAAVAYANRPKTETPKPQAGTAPTVEDGQSIKHHFGTVWVEDEFILAWKNTGTSPIRTRAGKDWKFKTKWQTVGYWYEIAFHSGLGIGPIDAYLEFRGGDKTAWRGEATGGQVIQINAPELWGGEDEQGGIVGTLDLMFGEATQMPSARLTRIFGPQQPAWRGVSTIAFEGRYGAMSSYPQKASHKLRKITAGWDGDAWNVGKAAVPMPACDGREPYLYVTSTLYPSVFADRVALGLGAVGGYLRTAYHRYAQQPDSVELGFTAVEGLLFVPPLPETEPDRLQFGLSPIGGILRPPPSGGMRDAASLGLAPAAGRLLAPPIAYPQPDRIALGVTPSGGRLYVP